MSGASMLRIGLVLLALGVAGGVGYWTLRPRQPVTPPAPPPDQSAEPEPTPEPKSTSPYRNTDPAVKYVGSAACAPCHGKQCETYHKHPMGRSITPAAGAVAELGGFDAAGVLYEADRRDGRIVHRELGRDPAGTVVARTEADIDTVIGSGTHAYSYLLFRDGAVTQSPVTWFAQKAAFDLSPGFTGTRDRFERPVVAGCLFCHTDRVTADPDTLNSFVRPVSQAAAIGCERCHGPGELHISARTNGPVAGPDRTIVNPSALSPSLREDVCNQCHLGGRERVVRRGRDVFDYRPGLPLDETIRVFVVPPEVAQANRVAGHVEQMHASRCFQRSDGEMGCATCHDPHAVPKPEEKPAYFRSTCVECHTPINCSEPLPTRLAKTRGDDCTVCHMPKSETTTSHVALTDHRILRKPSGAADPDILDRVKLLVPFGRDRLDERDAELTRDLAVGLVARARTQSDTLRTEVSARWLPVLSRSVTAHPDDLPALESLGVALAWQGMLDQALTVCEATLRRAPRRELVLTDAAVVAQKLGRTEQSLGYWRRALAINPSSSRYRFEVANALFVSGDRETAVAECRKVLDRYGGHVPSRLLLAQYYWESGAKDKARAELTAALSLHPPNEKVLRERFADILR